MAAPVAPVAVKPLNLDSLQNTDQKPLSATATPVPLSGSNKVAIVTGGHTGIGMSIVNNLAGLGYRVVIASRNESKAQATIKTITDRIGSAARVSFLSLNLGSRKSVYEFVTSFRSKFDKLNVLVLNASIVTEARETTEDGLENTLQWNALSHYLMCVLFTDLMKVSEDPRIVHVASNYAGELDLNDLQFEKRPFNGASAYAQSKQVNRMLAKYLALHFQKNGIPILSNACHAGVADKQRVEIMSSPRNVPPSPRMAGAPSPSPRVDTPIPVGAAADASPLSLPLGSIARPVSPGIPGAPVPAPAPSPSSAPTPRNEPCRYYLQGHCLRGDRCQYLHVAPESLSPEEVEKYKPTPSPRSAPLVSPRSKPVPATPSKTALAMSGGEIPTVAGPRPTSPRPTDPPASPNSLKGSNGGPSPRPTEAFWATTLEQVTGQVVKTAKDQLGCRFLQKLLDDKVPNALETIYTEALPAFGDLMSDAFGNYLCQKLMEIASDKQRTDLVERICANLQPVSLSMQGARALWKLMDFLSPAQISLLREALRPLLLTLALDINGNVVVQKCVVKFAPDNQYIFDAFAAKCVDIATNRHGCYLFQRCVDHGTADQKRQLAYAVIEHAVPLMKDAYGNYVVQYILDQAIPDVVPRLAKKLAGHYTDLSTGKFSSNVVEKLLKLAEQPVLSEILKEMGKRENLAILVPDQYANYVIQTAILLSEAENFKILVALLHPHLATVRNTPHGKRIHNKILKTQLLHDLTNDACAETPTFLATSPSVKGVSGKYFELRQPVDDKLAEDLAAIHALAVQVHRAMGLPEPAPLS